MKAKHTMSDQQFNECLRLHMKTAVDLLDKGDMDKFLFQLVTHELVIDEATGEPNGTMTIGLHLLPEFPGGEKGRAMLAAIGAAKAEAEVMVAAIFMMAEAWATVWPADKPRPFKEVRHDPQKVEIVTVAGMTVDQRLNQARLDFSRDAAGNIVPGEVRYMDYGTKEYAGMGSGMLAAFYKGYFAVIEETVRQMKAEQYKYN